MVDLLRIEIFLHAAENLNFSEAGRILHLSQPTVSHHIKTLEINLGVTLFKRQGATIKLTDAGRLLVPWARRMLRDSIQMQEMMESLKEGMAGNLQIACSTTAGKYVLPHLAARFTIRHPNVSTKLLRCTPASVVMNLLEGEANLGVVSYEIPGKDIELQEFFHDLISVIVPRDHPFLSQEKILPEDLLEEPIIMREETSGTRKIVLSELAKHDISRDDLNNFMEVGNAEAIVRTVEAGYGISFVSRLAAACAIECGKVIAVPVDGLNLVRTIYMVRKRLKESHRPADAFWGFVHDPTNQDLIEMASKGDLDYKIRDL
ncbi:MAG: LysR family transcriptional regulator [Anaerolineales bacterium]|nr:LysR family transcriptional regulator [Anaerolineales bacterium]